jgi:hypothetical protein
MRNNYLLGEENSGSIFNLQVKQSPYPLLEKIWKEEKIPEEWEVGLLRYRRKEIYQIAITGEELPF